MRNSNKLSPLTLLSKGDNKTIYVWTSQRVIAKWTIFQLYHKNNLLFDEMVINGMFSSLKQQGHMSLHLDTFS